MQQGMLSSVLLSVSILLGVPTVSATEMQPQSVEQWLQEPQVHDKVAELLSLAIEDDIDGLNFALQRLSLPVQEVSRYLLLKKIEDQNLIMTPKMALFVEQQKSMVPTYQLLERGDGYEFTVPAFNYPAIANRLLKQWQQDQSTLAFVLDAERGELNLKQWLQGSEYQVQTREALLIRELDSLSPEAVVGLSEQLTKAAVVSWLPSSAVMVRLAQVSEDPEVYKLLWLMKADFNSEAELVRLAKVGNEFSLNQVIQASHNPSLKEAAITELTKVRPMSPEVKEFLISRMAISEDARFIAGELARQGYSSWLEELASTNQKVNSRAILSVLGQ
ncbi:hypothetical protein L1D54_01865 [Vibrio brasiliensis]|jgi:hypothetical protein|uniref:hypothetical protein n=1 Tax=Vibrio brasiliensis TaxID=170652 RepID=UPI001EFEBD4D|nr:hypothetical protein [Vibrio brasiliensis]MCG9749217.1 hypothetical protein [Vibrio brasiliensis]MCG9784922.1 hypothetical protein [Vibrio brasiliensis]